MTVGRPESTVRRGGRFRGRAAERVSFRGLALFVLPVPLFFGALGHLGIGDPLGALANLVGFAALMTAAWLNRQGERAAVAYETRRVAGPPTLPRKVMAAALGGLGVATAAVGGWGLDAAAALGMGIITTASHILAFGIDPIRAKGAGFGGPEAARVAGALDRAYGKINRIEALAQSLRDPQIERRVGTMLAELRAILDQIESDPRDLPRARRYLSVYLEGAHEATRKYVESRRNSDDPKLRGDYLALLRELEDSFGRGRETLMLEDRSDLEIEIEVLRDRLAQEA